MTVDEIKLNAFIEKAVGDLGAAATFPMVLVGTRLGLYEALRKKPLTSAELARKTGTFERYVREWAHQQAASGYLDYDPATRKFRLSPEQAFCLANEDSPLHLFAASEFLAAVYAAADRAVENFKTGDGMHWGEHHPCLFHAQEYFNRGTYLAELASQWVPALGLDARLRDGIDFADVGCGHGVPALVMAKAFPNSRFVGFDNHPASIKTARRKAREAGLKNVRFEVADATDFPGSYDVVACFECFHDMGDPTGVAKRARRSLRPGGHFIVIDPNASDQPEENHTPLGRVFYAGSTFMCCPASRALGGPALGAQAGPTRTISHIKKGGFRKVDVAYRTPMFMMLTARA
jgi:SAM-dependent methyltransferase